MKNLYFTSVLLCTITIMVHADKSCQYPASEDFFYHLRPYIEEGNVKGIAQLTAQLSILKQSKRMFDLDQCTKSYIDRVYKNIVDNRDKESLKLIAPFMVEYGQHFLEAPVNAISSTSRLMRARWEADVASQAPGVMITEIKKCKAHKIARAWPLLPRTTQKRIQEEAKKYYADNCGKVYSDDCYDFGMKKGFLDSLDYAFRKICKIMPQELKDQADAKEAAMKEKLAAYEASEAARVDVPVDTTVSTSDAPTNSEQSNTPIESAATSTTE